ncbi:thiamine diphosphokinase [Candidatus Leptofilum sp.]|uniref:thiamine diphosphokinase n=1 Tax=Candidatus Leptofilum sp. TaxID=3241576 RepID=UPI003B59D1DB
MALLIFANGVLDEVEWIRPYLTQATAVWAANGGSKHLFRLNHPPDRVIGDVDSLKPAVLRWLMSNHVPFDQHPPAKDETDLELALLMAAARPESDVWLFGLLGGRLDQMLANIFLLTNPALVGKAVQIITPTERAWLVRSQTEIVGQAGDLVSLIPLVGDVQGVTTSGLRWPLQEETLFIGQARGVSNRLTAEKATVAVENGLLLCIQSRRG